MPIGMMRDLLALSVVLLAGLAAVPATAEGEDAATAEMRTRGIVAARLARELSHREMATLNLAAHAAAAASLCPGLALDEPAIANAIDAAVAETTVDAEPDVARRHHDFALIGFGAMVGLMLEEGARRGDPFCLEARAFATEPGEAPFLRIDE